MADEILAYRGPGVRVSRWALVAFWLSILGALGFITVFAPLVALVAAMIVRGRIATRTDVSGQRDASAAVAVSTSSLILGLLGLILTASLCGCGGSREGSNRGTCAANLRGIVQSMNLYGASEADSYPTVSYAPYNWAMNNAHGNANALTTTALHQSYGAPTFAQAGSTQAIIWRLAAGDIVNTKVFICKSDPWATGQALTKDAAGRYYDNFQDGRQLSYSFAYPWRWDGKVGAWWKSTADASTPIAADVTPLQGTGTPARNLTPGAEPRDFRTMNSGNHQGEGQVVVFGDAHAEFVRRPDIGNDNIYSMSGTPSRGPSQFGGIPAGPIAPKLMADSPPFDIVMVPVRNETTGGF